MIHFKLEEFDSPDVLNSGSMMNKKFLKMLDKAREIAGIPFKINSGYRTEEHNKAINGSPSSSHLKGYAADIACTYSANRLIIVKALITAGFNRIGIAKTFIHVDNDPDKPEVLWTY